MSRNSGTKFTADQRQTYKRRVACAFLSPQSRLRIEPSEDAQKQLFAYLVKAVHPLSGMPQEKHAELVRGTMNRLIDEGQIYLNRRQDAWRISKDLYKVQKAQAQAMSASRRERRHHRHTVAHGAPALT